VLPYNHSSFVDLIIAALIGLRAVRKRFLLSHVSHFKTPILPRQARDKPVGKNVSSKSAGWFCRRLGRCSRSTRSSLAGEKKGFFRHLFIKMIILPRQARDKHRENSPKARFLATRSSRPALATLPSTHSGTAGTTWRWRSTVMVMRNRTPSRSTFLEMEN
jgi:hypothetical protein